MLLATQRIIKLLHSQRKPDYTIMASLIEVILQRGEREDAEILLDCFLEQPNDFSRKKLLLVIQKFGSYEHAHVLFERCIKNRDDSKEINEKLYHLFGYLKYEPARSFLLDQALDERSSHSHSQSAVMGLLHMNCSDVQEKIREAIDNCCDKNVFKEFVPALIYHLDEKKEALDKLYVSGSTIASTDCNAGIILAFALSPQDGRQYLKRVLWDEHWECDGGGTGTDYYTYIGLQHLGIRFSSLYREVCRSQAHEQKYRLRVFHALLSWKIKSSVLFPIAFSKPPQETLESIYEMLFAWKTPNKADDIFSIIKDDTLKGDFYELKGLLELKMQAELLDLYG